MLSAGSEAAAWAAFGSVFVAAVVTWGADVVSRRRERSALTGNYVDLVSSLRGRLEDVEGEQERLRGLVARLRRRITVLRHALLAHGVEIPPDSEDADF